MLRSARGGALNLVTERIALYCERLKLTETPEKLEALAQEAAENEFSYSEFLSRLLELEVTAANERATLALVRFASLPFYKTLSDFDFSFQKSVDKRKIEELATLRFIESGDNIILVGPPGVGKTHLAVALAIEAAGARHRVKFTTLADMVASLQRSFDAGNLAQRLPVYTRPSLLVIDEIGFLPLDRSQASLFFQVICRRYEHGSIIITSNKSYGDWAEIFSGDEVIAAAILDRLLHHSSTISIRGESYRLREKKKAGLIGTKGGENLTKST